jgi:hypothetical protein
MTLLAFTHKSTDTLGDWLAQLTELGNALADAERIMLKGQDLETSNPAHTIHNPDADPPIETAESLLQAMHGALDNAEVLALALSDDATYSPRFGPGYVEGLEHFTFSYALVGGVHKLTVTPVFTTGYLWDMDGLFASMNALNFGVRPSFWTGNYSVLAIDAYSVTVDCESAKTVPVGFTSTSYLYRVV